MANEGPILIKKYSNRRLYDTRRSGYITLEDLAGMIRDGATVKVVDAANGNDLTRQVLTQVILDEQDRLDLIPVELLHHIIHVQGTMMQGPFAAFLNTAISQFLASGNVWQQQVDKMMGGWAGFGGTAAAGKKAEPPADESPAEPPPEPEAPKAGGDLDELRDRMDALLGRLNK